MKATIPIHMFSGPRNISTTMMRAFENRPDTAVVDEPFYARYLARTGADHPYRKETLAAQPHDADGVFAWLAEGGPAHGKPGADYLLCKHIAYHFEPGFPLDFLLRGRAFLLIRDPARMVASYAKKSGAVAPIIDSFRVEASILDFLEAKGRPCPVIDSADILAAPEAMLRGLCAALDMPFSPAMLAWPAGSRASDGAWAPHWYDAVNASTGFNAPPDAPASLTPELAAVAERCRADFEKLRARRLRA